MLLVDGEVFLIYEMEKFYIRDLCSIDVLGFEMEWLYFILEFFYCIVVCSEECGGIVVMICMFFDF